MGNYRSTGISKVGILSRDFLSNATVQIDADASAIQLLLRNAVDNAL